MGVLTISPVIYGGLLAKALPKVIETDEEFDRFSALLESLDFPERKLTPEETALEALLVKLIADYEDKIELPDVSPCEMVKFLMDQRGLKQADLVPVLGTRTQVSDVVTGRRGISKAQAKKLAEFFRVGVELFI